MTETVAETITVFTDPLTAEQPPATVPDTPHDRPVTEDDLRLPWHLNVVMDLLRDLGVDASLNCHGRDGQCWVHVQAEDPDNPNVIVGPVWHDDDHGQPRGTPGTLAVRQVDPSAVVYLVPVGVVEQQIAAMAANLVRGRAPLVTRPDRPPYIPDAD